MSDRDKPDLGKWEILEKKTVYECNPWIKVEVQKIKLPNGNVVDDFHRLVMPEYVVVYPVTTNENILMLKAYRHGIGDLTYLFPGGLINKYEKPLDAAQRELLEETGYVADNWQCLGSYVLHSNYGGGKAHMFRATGVEKVQRPNSGDLEETLVQLFDLKSLNEKMVLGQISSLSSIAALLLGEKENLFYEK